MPFNFIYKTNGDNGGFFFGAGPVIGIGIGGETKLVGSGSINGEPQAPANETSKIKFDGKRNANDDGLHLKNPEIGANFLAGYELSNGLRFSLQARAGLNNISPYKPEDEAAFNKYKSTYVGLNIGFRF